MKLKLYMIFLIIILLPNICFSDDENIEIIDFLKECIQNYENMETVIKDSKFYNPDLEDKVFSISKKVNDLKMDFIKNKKLDFIYLGHKDIFNRKLDKSVIIHTVKLDDSVGISFFFEVVDGDYYLSEFLPTYSGEVETILKMNKIEEFVDLVLDNNKLDIDSMYFDYYFPNDFELKYHVKMKNMNYKLRELIKNDYDNEIVLLKELVTYHNAYLYMEKINRFVHEMDIRFSSDKIIRFTYYLEPPDTKWKLAMVEELDE